MGWWDLTVNDAVAKRIYNLLEKYDMTKYRLEQKSSIYHGAMNRILSGQNKTVTLTTLYKLANGFDITIFEFLDDDLFRSEDIELD